MRPAVVRLTAACTVGLVLGAALTWVAAAAALDRARLDRDRLQLRIEELSTQVTSLRKRLNELERAAEWRHHPTVSSVRTDFDLTDEAEKIALQKAVKPYVKDLVGKRLEAVDPLLIRQIFVDRRVVAGGQTYQLRLDVIVLAEELVLGFHVIRLGPAEGAREAQ